MIEFTDAYIQNGTVSYNPGADAVPTTTEVKGNVTINNVGRPAVPPSFDVEFRVQSELQIEGLDCRPYISISVPVAISDKTKSFKEIEGRAADYVVPILRAITDAVEAQMKRIAEKDKEEAAAIL